MLGEGPAFIRLLNSYGSLITDAVSVGFASVNLTHAPYPEDASLIAQALELA